MKNSKISFLIVFLIISLITACIITGCGGGSGMFGSNTPTAVPENEKEFIVNGPVPVMANGGGQVIFAPSLAADEGSDFNANYDMIVTNWKDQAY